MSNETKTTWKTLATEEDDKLSVTNEPDFSEQQSSARRKDQEQEQECTAAAETAISVASQW